MIYRSLISAAQLQALQDSPTPPVVLDCSFDLGNTESGERAWSVRHVSGSQYAHLDRDLSTAKAPEGPRSPRFTGRHPLPERAAFAALAGRLGIEPGTQVVTFDAQGGPYSARAWWLVRWLGHDAVAVLDGGLAAWEAAGGAMTNEVSPPRARSPYPVKDTPAMPTIDAAALLASLGRVRLLDARNAERFRGENETLDPVGGRIPGATLRFFKDNLQSDGRFKPAAQLRAEFEALAVEGAGTVHQCGSGVTACHNILAMVHAGLDGSVLYPGSWSEWCADPARPVALG